MHHRRVVSDEVVAKIKADPAATKVQASIDKLHTAQWFECCNGGDQYRINVAALDLDADLRQQVVCELSDNKYLKKVTRTEWVETEKTAVTLRTWRPMDAKDMRFICEKCIKAVLVVEQVRVESALWPIYKLH